MKWIDLAGPITGDSVYAANVLVARDVGFTLPEINFSTAEYNVGGQLELPVTAQVENMEASITRIGFDAGMGKMLKLERQDFEIRFTQDLTDTNGSVRTVGCKAFLGLVPKGIPGFDVTLGERSEIECSYTALKYRLIVDNKELLNIDKLARKCVVDGKDYYQSIDTYL